MNTARFITATIIGAIAFILLIAEVETSFAAFCAIKAACAAILVISIRVMTQCSIIDLEE